MYWRTMEIQSRHESPKTAMRLIVYDHSAIAAEGADFMTCLFCFLRLTFVMFRFEHGMYMKSICIAYKVHMKCIHSAHS